MKFVSMFLIFVFSMIAIAQGDPKQSSCNVYKHGNKTVEFTYLELRVNGMTIPMTSIGSDMPYRVDDKASPKYTIEPVVIHDMNSEDRFGTMWAILINDVLYRPDCKDRQTLIP